MKQALILIDEINRKKRAILKTKSQYLVNDYAKSIGEDIKELRDYCGFKKMNFQEIVETYLKTNEGG